jgi:HEAT repeat protein
MINFVAGLLIGVGLLGLAGGAFYVLTRRKDQTSARVRMLAKQYQAMTDSAGRDIPVELLARPEFISSRMEFRKIEAIEAELTGKADREVAQKLLKDFFKLDDPWVKARAAKALYPLDPRTAFIELKALARNTSPFIQIPGIWALGEVGSESALELLMSLVWSKSPEVQQAVIRCLVQMETRQQIPPDSRQKVKRLLKELRYKTDWIL